MLCADKMMYAELLLWMVLWTYLGYDLDQVISKRIIVVVIRRGGL